MINALSTGASTPQDNDYYVSQYVGGGTKTVTYHRRPMSALWAYIKSKADSIYANASHNHDSRYYTESEMNTKLNTKANAHKTGWGNSIIISTFHGLLICNHTHVYIVWVSGGAGSYVVNVTRIYGPNDNMNFSVNKNTGVVTASTKDGGSATLTFIGF